MWLILIKLDLVILDSSINKIYITRWKDKFTQTHDLSHPNHSLPPFTSSPYLPYSYPSHSSHSYSSQSSLSSNSEARILYVDTHDGLVSVLFEEPSIHLINERVREKKILREEIQEKKQEKNKENHKRKQENHKK